VYKESSHDSDGSDSGASEKKPAPRPRRKRRQSQSQSQSKNQRSAPKSTPEKKRKQTHSDSDSGATAKKRRTASIATTTATTAATTTATATATTSKKRALPASSAASKANEMLATRLANPRLLIGAHVSAAKGIQNAIANSLLIGGNSFALFLKSQRRWVSPALDASDAGIFRAACAEHNYDPATQILPHASYLINLAQHDRAKAEQAYGCLLDDLKRCEALGIGLYNLHPGSTLGEPRDEALGRISAALNRAHAETKKVKTVIENMAGAGNIVGSAFEDLRDIISGVTDKSRVGVCLDTCHLFAAGHDISTAEGYADVMRKFDGIVGRQYLCALHLNDSKAPLGSRRDLHSNIGQGYLGLEAFRFIVNDERLHGLPMVLETPTAGDPKVWADEIKLLESLVGMTGEEDELKTLAEKLQARGRSERKRILDVEKGERKKPTKRVARRKKGKTEEEEGDSDGSGCSH